MKSKKKKKYYAGGSASPAKVLGDMQRAKMGVAKGSYLEGGTIKYKNSGPGGRMRFGGPKTAEDIEDKAMRLEAEGGNRKYKRSQKLYAKSDAMKNPS